MQEAEEQDTCRICSAPGEPDQPLFYPCKCSGTIRYIHQDCLTTWLAHSKKKTCDVCKHPYSFTKVYAADMPLRLPPVLLIRRLAQQCLFALIFALRAVVVAVVWLAALPWATVWTWRMYFTMGDSTAWWISDRPRSSSPNAGPDAFSDYHNLTVSGANSNFTLSANMTFFEWTLSRPFWRAVSADIFAGQIIATFIVLTFVAVFLLREWISQNARPGVFEEEDLFGENRELPPLEPVPQPAAQPQAQPRLLPLGVPPNDAPFLPIPAPDMPPPHVNRGDRIATHGRGTRRQRRPHGSRPFKGADNAGRRRRDNGKGKARDDDGSDPESDEDHPSATRARTRRRLHSGSEDTSDDSDVELEFSHNLRDLVGAAAMRRAEAASSSSAAANADEVEKFEFTFRASTRSPPLRRSTSEPRSSPGVWSSDVNSSPGSADTGPISSSSELNESTDPTISPSSSSDTLSSTASPQSGIPSLNPSVTEKIFATNPSVPSEPVRRPPMPGTTFPTPNVASTSTPDAGPTRSGAQTPLASPGLATYRAPEELEGGPSTLTEYFDQEGLTEEELKAIYETYFRPPRDEAEPPPLEDIPALQQTSDEDEDEEGDDEDDDDDYEHVLAEDDEDDDDEDEEGVDEEDALEFDGEAEWEDGADQEQEGGEQRQLDLGIQQQPAPGPPAPVEAPDGNDDIEGNVEDDMEGAMEAIGMRGPVYGVIQNAALMVFVLDTAIGLGVWLPFTIGKSTALLSLDPHRFLQIIHLPIRAMRIITDPVVDSIAFLIKRFALPPALRVLYLMMDLILSSALYLVGKVAGQATSDRTYEHLTSMYLGSSEPTDSPFNKVLQWISPSEVHVAGASGSYSVDALFEIDSPLIHSAEPHFAALGKEVRLSVVRLKTTWTRLALGDGTTEKVFAVILGYAVVALLLALYLNILTVGNVKSAGRAARSAVRQQLLVLKVAVFIVIELVIFPLGCGVMLDVCSVWLFPEANIQSRAVFFVQSPVTAMFYHWVAGTMFMYQFAILLAACRGIMRPGAMWFIKDPQDQNFHPIRDILERPTLTQLRKLLVSAVMYSVVVALGVGSVAGLLFAGFNSVLPLRWKTREPLSDVPIDLLFLHFVLPYTMHYFRPKKAISHVVVHAWKQLAKHLRLTSYMFGDRYPMEEFTPQHASWTSIVMTVVGIHDPRNIHDGSFRRVPASDNVALPRDMRATAEVDANGEPMTDAAAKLMQLQNAEAEKAKRNVKSDYTVVYIPPHFRYRIMLFIFALWVAFAIFVAMALSVPILLGRSFFKLFTVRDVHDGYSFITGFYLLWGCYIIGKAVDRMDKRRQRRGHDGPRAEFSVFLAKRSLLWLAKISYMLFFLGLVIPTLISLVMDFYIVLPIRLAVNPTLKPRIRIVDAWALGLLYAKIAVHAHRLQHPTPVIRGLNNIANNGWTHPDPWKATKEIIGPVTGGLTLLLLCPAAIVRGLQSFSLPIDGKFIFMHVYPGIFAVVGLGRSIMVGMTLLSSWSQSIRDKEFLVEMRLRNHEPAEEEKKKAPEVAAEAELSDN